MLRGLAALAGLLVWHRALVGLLCRLVPIVRSCVGGKGYPSWAMLHTVLLPYQLRLRGLMMSVSAPVSKVPEVDRAVFQVIGCGLRGFIPLRVGRHACWFIMCWSDEYAPAFFAADGGRWGERFKEWPGRDAEGYAVKCGLECELPLPVCSVVTLCLSWTVEDFG